MYSTLILCIALWIIAAVLAECAKFGAIEAKIAGREDGFAKQQRLYAVWQVCKFFCCLVFFVVAVVKSLILVNS